MSICNTTEFEFAVNCVLRGFRNNGIKVISHEMIHANQGWIFETQIMAYYLKWESKVFVNCWKDCNTYWGEERIPVNEPCRTLNQKIFARCCNEHHNMTFLFASRLDHYDNLDPKIYSISDSAIRIQGVPFNQSFNGEPVYGIQQRFMDTFCGCDESSYYMPTDEPPDDYVPDDYKEPTQPSMDDFF